MTIPFEFYPAKTTGTSVIVPSGLTQKDELFSFYATAFCFPGYFGYNWDALDECLRDMQNWHPKERCFTLLHQDIPLVATLNDAKVYLEILSEILTNRNSLIKQVVFHSSDSAMIQSLLGIPNSTSHE